MHKNSKMFVQLFLRLCFPERADSTSYEVYRLLVGADPQGDREVVKKRKRKDGNTAAALEEVRDDCIIP